MKFSLSTLQQSHFKETGKISFDNVPFNTEEIESEMIKCKARFTLGRDLWRGSEKLKKLLLKTVGPIVLELLSKKRIRLLADQYLEKEEKKKTLDSLFGFSELLCVVSIEGDVLTFLHPSMPLSPSMKYVALFGRETSVYMKKESDPANRLLKEMGYGFGDLLKNDTHPLIY